jgi:hypothetical protein
MARKQIEVPSQSSELGEADLGDARLSRRLGLFADRLAERPDASFPKALDDAELEAAYRFFGNDSVRQKRSWRRISGRALAELPSDSGSWSFTTRRSSSFRAIRNPPPFRRHLSDLRQAGVGSAPRRTPLRA